MTATDTLLTGTGAPFAVARNYILTVNALAPGVPTIGAATPGNAQASIAFTAPATNGSAITSYTVTCNPGGITATGATSPIIVTGLTNGNAYNCSVVATNGVGSGGASATVAVTIGVACAAGAWSASGFAPCAAAAPGYFVANAGAMMQTACVPGTCQPGSGQAACLPAQAGFYATGPAATAQLPCGLGSTSTAGAAVCARLPLLNIDDSDAPDVYSPSTDGTLLLRYLLGLRGTALTAGATGTNARRNAAQIVTHIETYITLFDVDGDGQTRALTDGVMIVQRMLGLSGSALTSGAKNSARSDDAVRDAIDALKP